MSLSYERDVFSSSDGLQVIAVQRPWGKTFAASLIYAVGTFHDPTGIPGTAHFAEHLAFAGENKPLVAQVARLGTRVNAVTGHDYTCFQAAGHVDDFDLSLRFFENIVRTQAVTPSDIASERNVFFHELNSNRSQAERNRRIDSFWRRHLGDPNWRSCQTKASVKVNRFTPVAMNTFKQQHYLPSNAIFVIVSPLACEDIRERLNKASEKVSVIQPAADFERCKELPRAKRLTVAWDRQHYVWVDVMHSLQSTSPTIRLAADMIAYLVGGGPHSKMFQTLRVERGIAYLAYANDWAYLSRTAIHCFFSVRKRAVNEAFRFAVECLNEIAEKGISEDEFEAEKRRMIRWHELEIDHPSGLASYLAYQALRREQSGDLQLDGYQRALTSMTWADINHAAAELLSRTNRSAFVGGRVGPILRVRMNRWLVQ